MSEYEATRARVRSAEEDLRQATARLDAVVARQEELQTRLNSRASGMYRGRRLSFVDILTNSASFSDFSTRLEMLTRMNLRDARDLIELKRTKVEVAEKAAELLARQERASVNLRGLEASKRAAQRELSASKAAFAEYQQRTAEPVRQSAPAPTRVRPTRAPAPTGGAWRTAVASHYGSGSWGRRTADGTTLGPNSMIVAHKTLPFGTMVQFRFRGRTAVARVADRGPYTPGRTWDLGPGVINVLDFNGVHEVEYRILGR